MASIKITFSDDTEPRLPTRDRRPSSTIPISNRRKSTARKPSTLLSPTLQIGGDYNLPPQRRMSRIGRNHFLRSFGKDTLYGYQGVEDVLPERTDDLADKPPTNCQETVQQKEKQDETDASLRLPRRPSSSLSISSGSAWLYKDILQVRGKEYKPDDENISESIKEKIRSQSAKRRIRRIMLADKEKAEAAASKTSDRKTDQKKRRTLKGTTFSLLALKATTGTFDMFMEKKKWLAESRMRKKRIAKEMFHKAAVIVRVLCKFLKVIQGLSTQQTPITAAQKSWHALKHTSEAKEILFNMTIFQKGKSQYAYVPEWAKHILAKPPMERTDMDLSQLHAVLKGLQSYDKFTYRIQMAMCRAMTYQRVEHGRTILRKGHEGLAFYFIFSGSAFVNVEELLVRSGHVVWHTAVVLHRGDSFGELALLRKIKRTASVVVREDIELLVVDRDVFAITCPKIYDKELGDKITFCQSLKFFQGWSEEMLRNICFEAQIQDWKSNKIIVRDSSKDTEWIYICMQGKCSVIKALDLHCPPGLFGPKRITFEESYFNLFGKGRKSSITSSTVWKKELEKSFKQPYSFANKDKKVDEHDDSDNAIESDSDEDESSCKEADGDGKPKGETAKERIIQVMELSYSEMPHAKGDSQYCEIDDEKSGNSDDAGKNKEQGQLDQSQIVLEKRIELNSLTLLDLMRLTDEAGKLHKDVVFLDIAHLQSGDIFDLSEILMPTGRKLMLVSNGAVLLRIKRADFLRYSTKTTIKCARDIALQSDYPTDENIYRSYNDRCAWEDLKKKQLLTSMNHVQEACVRHNQSIELGVKYNRKPLKNVKGILRKEEEEKIKLNKLDEYLEFVYGPNNAELED